MPQEDQTKKEDEKFVPNTTQVPNIILDVWMDRLSDVELRVLLVITRQTMGWLEDPKTGRRKEKDWISMSQLIEKTGRGRTAISGAVKHLVDELRIVEALDSKGKTLDAEKRQRNASKIFYRLNLKLPEISLFDTKTLYKSSFFRVQKVNTKGDRVQKVNAQKVNTTKETHLTKENNINTMQPAEPVAPDLEKKDEKKAPSAHKEFMEYWHDLVPRTRGVRTVIITGADARNLKRVLELGVEPTDLQKMALFFLADYSFKTFSPSISTFLSAGILTGLLNRTKNDPEFWKKLTNYQEQYFRGPKPGANTDRGFYSMREAMEKLLEKFAAPRAAAQAERI